MTSMTRAHAERKRRDAETGFASAAVCIDCIVCGSGRSRTVCSCEDMAAQRQYLTTFFRRRWRVQNGAAAADRLAFTQDYTTDIVGCENCGLLYRNPRPRREDITRAYRHDRYDDYYLEAEFANQRAWAGRKAPQLARYIAPGFGRRAHVLEIGSFVGGLLAEGLARGWDMFGIDPGDDVTEFCRAKGLPVFHGTVEEADLHPERFDAVVIWNTFDQLPDPHPTLEAAARLLRDGGVLTIRVPNGACFSRAMAVSRDIPAWVRGPLYTALAWNNLLTFPYVYGYSADTLTALMAPYGFRRMACVPDTLMAAPAGHTKWWATVEARIYDWAWRASWHTSFTERWVCAPWIDLYFERAAAEDLDAPTSARERGLGLIPVYAPLAVRQTNSLVG